MLEIPTRNVEARLFGAAAGTQLVLLLHAGPENLILPVGVGQGVGVGGQQRNHVGVGHHLAAIGHRLPEVLQELVAVEQVQALGHLLHARIGREVEAGFAVQGSALGRHNHNAVAAARAVNGAGCGILQHLHTLNVAGRNLVVAVGVVERVAVHYVQRVVAGRNRAQAAHPNHGALAGLARGLGNLDAGHQAHQGFVGRSHRNQFHLLGRDGGDGCGQHFLLLHAVAYHHYFFQAPGVGRERSADGRAATHGFLLGGIAHEGKNEGGVFGGFDAVAAVGIGLGAVVGALHDDVDAG